MGEISVHIVECKCGTCGKKFYVMSVTNWAYKIKRKSPKVLYFCTWGCLRRYEKEHNIVYDKTEDYLY